MKKIIACLIFIPFVCSAQQKIYRPRLNILEKTVNPAKQTLNNLMFNLQHQLTLTAQRVGVLRRNINYLGSEKSLRIFKEELQSACNRLRDHINTTLPRSTEALDAIFEE